VASSVRIFRGDVLEARSTDLEAGLSMLDDPDARVWIDTTRAELPDLAQRLGFNSHAVEDAMKEPPRGTAVGQRAKLERFPRHVFLYLFRARLKDDGNIALYGIPVFATRQVVVAVDVGGAYDVNELDERWDAHPELLKFGSPAMLHAILDLVIDSQLAAVDALSDDVDSLEDALFDGADLAADDGFDLPRRGFATRKSLVRLRRVVAPMREIVSGIMRREEDDATPIDAALMPYYQDLYDHTLRTSETIEGLRDLLTTIYETRLAMADHTMNVVVKKLSGWAAIIAVPTAVTGFYGQNVRFPGLLTWWGFGTSTAIWVASSVALYVAFRRRRWI
jgi:magnesium transporter